MTVPLHHVLDGPAGGDTVVLAGALGSDVSMWQPQVAPLVAAGLRVLRFDHRGHGASPVPPSPYSIADLAGDAAALLLRLGSRRVHWVGLSLGAGVGMWLAAHRPELVDRLVLCCASPRLDQPRTPAAAAPASWLTPAADPELARRMLAMFTATPAEGVAGCRAALAGMDLVADLRRITAPTLVVAGAQDQATPLGHARRIAYSVPGARLAVVDGAAHLGSVERPSEFTALIMEHLLGERPDSRAMGMAVRRAVLGADHVDRAVAATTEFDAPFQDHITSAVWGALWTRDVIDLRMRSAITLAVLAALGCDDELALHVRGALRNGLTAAEVGEVLLHVGAYAGVPAARTAFRVAQQAIDATGAAERPKDHRER